MSDCISDTKDLNRYERTASGAIMALGLFAFTIAASPGFAGEFGSFTLKPGETQQIRIGSTYRTLRVCNDAGSAGSILVTIDDHNPHHLAAGVCAEDLGDAFVVVNQSSGPAHGTYRPMYEVPFEGK
ncbi:MAG: hypothetical protein QOK29_851 [Rhodospirillaceae bacterium]|nr:hypothetical protein [Rhodospirillaceae bacterium]